MRGTERRAFQLWSFRHILRSFLTNRLVVNVAFIRSFSCRREQRRRRLHETPVVWQGQKVGDEADAGGGGGGAEQRVAARLAASRRQEQEVTRVLVCRGRSTTLRCDRLPGRALVNLDMQRIWCSCAGR